MLDRPSTCIRTGWEACATSQRWILQAAQEIDYLRCQKVIKRLFIVILSAAKNLSLDAAEIRNEAALRSEWHKHLLSLRGQLYMKIA